MRRLHIVFIVIFILFAMLGCSSSSSSSDDGDDSGGVQNDNWTMIAVDSSGNVGIDPSLALDSNDIPHTSYYDQDNRDLKYAYLSGSTFEVVQVDTAGDVGEESGIVIDSNDKPHISYLDVTNNALKYAKKVGSTFETETVYDEDNYKEVSTSIRLYNDLPRIAFNAEAIEQQPDEDLLDKVGYASYDGTSWEVTIVTTIGGTDVYLDLDPSGNAHLSFKVGSPSLTYDKIYYATNTSGSFVVEAFDPSAGVGGDTGIAVDSNGRPHIVYRDYENAAVKYAYYNGSTWEVAVVDSSGGANEHTRIALDSNDNPHVIYSDEDAEVLRYATKEGSSFILEDVNRMGNTDVKLDSSDIPHIVHTYSTGTTTEILKYSVRE